MQVFVVVHSQRAPDCHSSASQVARAPVATATYTLVHHRASLNIMTIDSICMTALSSSPTRVLRGLTVSCAVVRVELLLRIIAEFFTGIRIHFAAARTAVFFG